MPDKQSFNQELLEFISRSPTPFHAVANLATRFDAAGFLRLDEAEAWSLQAGKAYYVIRNDSALIAFRLGLNSASRGVSLAGAHTDSPCLKLKPNPEVFNNGYLQLGVEVYGGALLNPWFDRDLSIAGKVSYRTAGKEVRTALLDLRDPVAVIPSLAIHLDREVNTQRSINAQQHLPPVLLQVRDKAEFSFDAFLLERLHNSGYEDAEKVLAHELSLYDTQKPSMVGLRQEFIAAARLDNLLSCFLISHSLLESSGQHSSLVVCNDHEEVGSASASGAQGPFLKSVLRRMLAEQDADSWDRMIQRSLFLSVDNAHGVHPNYADKHDPGHGPRLNGGPVIKINANQRYASNSESVARFKSCCETAGVASQSFVMRSDLACGSTIGPLTATQTGINTVDVGVPTFAMHSIRELAGADDAAALARVVRVFFDRA